MARRGRFKYKCADCGYEQFVDSVERARRTRPRCMGCGSAALDPVTREGKDHIKIGNTNLAQHRDDRGDVIKST